MSKKPLPEGYALSPHYNPKDVFKRRYKHWTVADLIEILQDFPQDARVWTTGTCPDDIDEPWLVEPIDMVSASEGEVFL